MTSEPSNSADPAASSLSPTGPDANIDCTAFGGLKRIASGLLADVVVAAKAVLDRGEADTIAIFDNETSRPIEVDFRGSVEDVRRRLAAPPAEATPRGPGRPKLGVVAREITLLPRHWDWLNAQPGGASVALRRLVEAARRDTDGEAKIRVAREAANRFMTAMAGDRPGYEEATRALFAGDQARFDAETEAWPADIRDHSRRLAIPAFASI
ncbi:hypothetical protein SAMN02745157_1329 [Kaistia soli DSM 19436]|uniref:DUF2239 domain-containing protein n=1 Tax=Kaistia soli DSM 19436 TaxID=1122133 RepID=A0A1M4XSJ7_9HYPH|nr:DUF2239 family protein [Kaistia soli]SHE96370.1 hypothetical protein SAMN02745157_1329 [Kaistia soli DSM 19436]